jgi:hypothetical protein
VAVVEAAATQVAVAEHQAKARAAAVVAAKAEF